MDTMYIITRIMQSGPFSFDGFRYFLDYVIAVAPLPAAGATSPRDSCGIQRGAAADPLREGGGASGSWIVRRARLRPDGGYDMSTAEYVCNFTL